MSNRELCRLVVQMLNGEVEPEIGEAAIYERFGEAAERPLPRQDRPTPAGDSVNVATGRADR